MADECYPEFHPVAPLPAVSDLVAALNFRRLPKILLHEHLDGGLRPESKSIMKAMKSAFIPHQRRAELIRHRMLFAYSMILAELAAKAFASQLPSNSYLR